MTVEVRMGRPAGDDTVAKAGVEPGIARSRATRVLLMVTPLVLLAAWLGADWWFERRAEAILDHAESQATSRLEDLKTDIGATLKHLHGIPAVLAAEDVVKAGAAAPRDAATKLAIKRRLRVVQQALGFDAALVVTADGTCFSSSDYLEPNSVVGESFADRDFFREAAAGRLGQQFAVDRRTNAPALFFSAPISARGKFLGVVAITTDVVRLSQLVPPGGVFVTDPFGVVIVADDPSLIYSSLPTAAVEHMPQKERQLRYKRDTFPKVSLVDAALPNHPSIVRFQGKRTILMHADLPEERLTVHALADVSPLDDLLEDRLLLFFGLASAGLLSTGALGMALSSAYRARIQTLRLSASRDFANAILDSVASHIAILDRNGMVLQANGAWRRAASASPSVAGCVETGANFLAALRHARPAEGFDAVADGLAVVLAGHRHEFSHSYQLAGQSRWFALRALPLKGGDDRLVVSLDDITDLKAAEAALRVSEERLALATQGAHMGVWDRDILNDALIWDDQMFALYGLDGAQVQPTFELFKALVHPDDRDRVMGVIGEAVRRGGRYENDFRVVWPSGEVRYVRVRAQVFTDESGRPVRMAGINYDITDSRRAQDELSSAKHFLDKIINAAPEPIFVKDRQHRWIILNDAFCALLGRPREALLGRSDFDYFSQEEAKVFWEKDELVFSNGSENINEETLTDASGKGHVIVTKKVAFSDQNGSQFIVGTIRDITEQTLAEVALNKAKFAAEKASRAKSEFLANMSHEIRTPMNAILVLVRLLEEAELGGHEREYVARMRLSVQSLLGILNNILDFSKIEAGRLELERSAFSLEEILNPIAAIVSTNGQDKDIEIVFRVEPGLPDGLMGDQLRLQQVLLNLAGNAVKFTNAGEVVISVTKSRETRDSVTLLFAVRDSGMGIAPDRQERLFEAFWQADTSTSRRFGGSGLGLAISHRLVALMGGAMTFTSELGKGSEFLFSATFGKASPGSLPAPPPRDEMPGLVTLVVDDNEAVRQSLSELCTAFGWMPVIAPSGQAGMDVLRRMAAAGSRIDVLMVDWSMEDMDGLEIVRRVKAEPALVLPPTILMVAPNRRDAVDAAARDLGISRILAKPIMPAKLYRAVARLLRGHHTPGTKRASVMSIGGRLTGRRLLLVEDNEINQQVERAVLERAGALVEIAGDGESALRMLEKRSDRFDAVLMDIQMPGMDGYEATRIIRRQIGLADLPIIAMTANAMASDRMASREAGMDAHVAKPIDVDDLIATLAAMAPRLGKVEAPIEGGPVKSQPGLDPASYSAPAAGPADAALRKGLERLLRAVREGNLDHALDIFARVRPRLIAEFGREFAGKISLAFDQANLTRVEEHLRAVTDMAELPSGV